jgi:hypothetical protein
MRSVALKPLATTVAVTTAVLLGSTAGAEAPSPTWLTRPCPSEDSVNCFWDAGAAGNGSGHSFFAVKVRDQVCVLYGEDRYARRHNHCAPLR